MKTKIREISYEEFLKIKPYKRFKPQKPSKLLNFLIRYISKKELKECNFKYTSSRMEMLGKKEPCLILMNHSCFLDLKIAFTLLKGRRFNIVMTDDGFVGKAFLMKKIGCIPTMKFITDTALVKDMLYIVNKMHNSILLYPEASYSFDGKKTPLPKHFAKLVKKLNIPVVMIKTEGAFLRDPLYNNLQLRNVNVSAHIELLLTKEEINQYTNDEIFKIVDSRFDFDAFKYQVDNNILIKEEFRADYINRILYKCPICNEEHKMIGQKTKIICQNCNTEYTLEENGKITCDKKIPFDNPSSWYNYERECVKKEIEDNKYLMILECDIYAMKDLKAIYKIGTGKLTHSKNGFSLIGNRGLLNYTQKIKESYSVYSDFYWYEIDDIICIGDRNARYYCVPKNKKDVVAKVRIATEEMYKMKEE